MATTIHHFPSDGSSIARGTAIVADGDTVETGLPQVDGFIGKGVNADTVIGFTSQSAGTVTVSVYAAGGASSGTKTIHWNAWCNKKV